MVFLDRLSKHIRQRLNSRRSSSRRSSSSPSTNSEIDMADFRICSTSTPPQNQPIASFDHNNLGARDGSGFGYPKPSTSDALGQEGSNIEGFDENPVPDNDSDLTNKSGGLLNDEVWPDNDNESIGADTDHLDLPGEPNERLDGELRRNDARLSEEHGHNEEPGPGNLTGEPIERSHRAGVSERHGNNEGPRPGNDSIVNNSTENDSVNNITPPPAKPYIRYVPVLPTTEPLESSTSARKDPAQPPIKMPMSVGPFGGPRGSRWDDGVYAGVKTIKLATGWIVDSIVIEYIDHNGDIVETRHGGSGGSTYTVELDYPNEYIISIWGYYGRIIEENEMYMRSLTFQTNIRTHGPFGVEEGKYFNFPTTGGKVIGFHGRGDSYLNAIGAYMELPSQN